MTEKEWTPEAVLGVRNVMQVRVSPDGERVVYVVSEAVLSDEKSEFVTRIHLARTDGGASRQITFGAASAGNPRWSPDGRWLAFTSRRGEGEKARNNLYRLPVDGPGEAEPLLPDARSEILDYRWSPDGTQIALIWTDPVTDEEEKRNKGKDDSRWVGEEIKYGRLYTLAVDGPREPVKRTHADCHVAALDWSPDGAAIVFAHTQTPRVDDWPTSCLSRVELATGALTLLVAGGGAAMQPLFSPDGRQIAFTRTDDPPSWAFRHVLHLLPASATADTPPRALPATFDEQPTLIGWSADSARLFFSEANGTLVRLAAMEVATGEIVDLSAGAAGLRDDFHLNATRTHWGFRMQSPQRAVEAFVSRSDRFDPVRVSQANASLADLPVGKTEAIRWRSADGTEVEGLLTYPVGYAAGTRVPLLLVIHGGPAGVFLQTFPGADTLYPSAAFAARGYAILRPNPRGSSGYGAAFRYANLGDWGGGDYQDILAGVDQLIADGIADPERLGVMGWSYGGYMTSWVITHTHRFKAASVGAAVTNLISFTGTSDIQGFLPSYFGGPFWDGAEAADRYRAHSPIVHVAGVTTPTLIQHPEADERVPVSQGYELFHALRQQGVETRMLVLPRQGHGPTEPKMLLQCLKTNLEWFEKWI